MHSLKRVKHKDSDGLLAFAYSSDSQNFGSTNNPGLGNELPGASRELTAISSIMKGKFYFGADATEENFKLNASQYSVIHFALHGEPGDSIKSARLIFRNEDDHAEDGYLYPHELGGIKLNANLIVLSSCETGVGKLYDGEGTYSMARGFVVAGCPSVVMTLWKINDGAASSIMTEFYHSLKDGNTINSSIRNSKLNYISSATALGAHPASWAAFIPLGEMASLEKNYFSIVNISILCGIIILCVVTAYVKRWFSASRNTNDNVS
jgi:CHAT domain-containing protein